MDVPPNFDFVVNEAQMTVTVRGPLRAADVIQLVKAKYPTFRGRGVLWDLTAADVTEVTKEDFLLVALAVRASLPPGIERKTAYVVSSPAASLAMWKYLNQSTQVHVPVEYQSFTDRKLAQRWLDQP